MDPDRGLQRLLRDADVFPPPADVAARALVPDYARHYADSVADVEAYWDRVARGFVPRPPRARRPW
jgi:hypothetical protein